MTFTRKQSIIDATVVNIATLNGGKLVSYEQPTVSDAWFVAECSMHTLEITGLRNSTIIIIYNGKDIREVYECRPKLDLEWLSTGMAVSWAEYKTERQYAVSRYCKFHRTIPNQCEKQLLDAAVQKFIDENINPKPEESCEQTEPIGF